MKQIYRASASRIDLYAERLLQALAAITFVAFLSFAWVATSATLVQAEAQPACGGNNLVAEYRETAPEKLQAIRDAASKTLNGKGIFWKVEREGTEPSWLLGTMHLADPRIARLDRDKQDAFDRAKTVVVESTDALDPQKAMAAMLALRNMTMLTDGTTLEDKLSEKVLAKLKPALEKRGMPFAVARMMQPWVVATSIAIPVCETVAKRSGAPVLDAMIANGAKQSGKMLEGLESIEEQFSAMAGLPQDFHLRSLAETLEMGSVANDVMETMKLLYLDGEIGMVLPMLKAAAPKTSNGSGYSGFQRELITKRNAIMAERSLQYLQNGNAFIAVGALHLPGETGLVEAFRQAGYTVTRAEKGDI